MASNLRPQKSPSDANTAQRDRLEPIDAPAMHRGLCEWCGGKAPRGRRYCSPECRVSYNNLLARQGKAIMQALKIWRKHRGRAGTPGAGMFHEICRRVDQAVSEDNERRDQMSKKDDGRS